MAYQKTVIPMLVDPTLATSLQIGEVHHSAHCVLRITSHKEITHVIVTMEVLTLPTVLMQPMPRTKLDPSHYCQRHRFLSSNYRVPENYTLTRLDQLPEPDCHHLQLTCNFLAQNSLAPKPTRHPIPMNSNRIPIRSPT